MYCGTACPLTSRTRDELFLLRKMCDCFPWFGFVGVFQYWWKEGFVRTHHQTVKWCHWIRVLSWLHDLTNVCCVGVFQYQSNQTSGFQLHYFNILDESSTNDRRWFIDLKMECMTGETLWGDEKYVAVRFVLLIYPIGTIISMYIVCYWCGPLTYQRHLITE